MNSPHVLVIKLLERDIQDAICHATEPVKLCKKIKVKSDSIDIFNANIQFWIYEFILEIF